MAGWLATLALAGCDGSDLRALDGALAAREDGLEFGLRAVGSSTGAVLHLINRGDGPVHVKGIEAGAGLSSAFVLPPLPPGAIPSGGTLELPFSFAPGEEARFEGTVLLRTDSRQAPELEIPLGGEGARPLVSCTPALDFGRVILNTEKRLAIECANEGRVAASVLLDSVAGDDAGLFGLPAATEILPGTTGRIEVRFEARRIGTVSARAILAVPGALEPLTSVTLTGEGYASDLVVPQDCIDFGPVTIGAVAERVATVENRGNRAISFEPPEVDLPFTVSGTSVVGTTKSLFLLEPGEVGEVRLRFAPTVAGPVEGTLTIPSDDATNPRIGICLVGRGGGANLLVTPTSIDFGALAPGMRAHRTVVIQNGGNLAGGPLRLHSIRVEGDGFSSPALAVTELDPSDPPAILEVAFHPTTAGSFAGKLVIETSDGDTPHFEVPLVGTAGATAPCAYVVEPPSIRFGSVQQGSRPVLAGSIRNVGSDECLFSGLRIADGSSTALALVGAPEGVTHVAPGEKVDVAVRLDASTVGSHSGAIHFYASDPNASQGSIPVTATVIEGCLFATPGSLDFGMRRLSCPAATREIEILNACGITTTVDSLALGPITGTAGEIEITAGATPLALAPGGRTSVEVHYGPFDVGHDAAPLQLRSPVHDLDIPIHGEGIPDGEVTERFVQQQPLPVDVLFVIDNSGSMQEEQAAIASAFDDFIGYAGSQGIDYHIGVTTTGITEWANGVSQCPGGAEGGESGRLFPVDGSRPRWITPTTPDAEAVFAANVTVGTCHWAESGLEAAYRALTPPLVDQADDRRTSVANDGNLGFLRSGARLSVIVVTDEDDHSPNDPSFYTTFFAGLKSSPGMVTVHGVLGDGCSTAVTPGHRYREVITASGGLVEPICTSDWGSSLASLAEQTFGKWLRFPLAQRPEGAVTVTVDGALATGWRYDAESNAVVFEEDEVPEAGASVEIRYLPSCD